jgi:hypothetical protein
MGCQFAPLPLSKGRTGSKCNKFTEIVNGGCQQRRDTALHRVTWTANKRSGLRSAKSMWTGPCMLRRRLRPGRKDLHKDHSTAARGRKH